jgi:DNA-binding transcriptional MerR regulator
MTQNEFDALPGLLTRAQFMAITGLSKDKLRVEVQAKLIGTHKSKPNGYAKYYKRDAARLGGFELK